MCSCSAAVAAAARPRRCMSARGSRMRRFAIQPAVPVGDAARPHRVELLTQGGAVVWSWRTTGGELRRRLDQADAILLQIPARLLPAGPYTLRVVPEGKEQVKQPLEDLHAESQEDAVAVLYHS